MASPVLCAYGHSMLYGINNRLPLSSSHRSGVLRLHVALSAAQLATLLSSSLKEGCPRLYKSKAASSEHMPASPEKPSVSNILVMFAIQTDMERDAKSQPVIGVSHPSDHFRDNHIIQLHGGTGIAKSAIN